MAGFSPNLVVLGVPVCLQYSAGLLKITPPSTKAVQAKADAMLTGRRTVWKTAQDCVRGLHIVPNKFPKHVSAAKAVSKIKSRDNVFIHGTASTPYKLIHELCKRHAELSDVCLYNFFTLGPAEYTDPKYKNSFIPRCFFVTDNSRDCVNAGHADYIPMFLSEVPVFLREKRMDWALMQVSPPDSHGFCSLGSSVDVAVSAMENARHVIAQVNRNVPRTHGDGLVHISALDMIVDVDDPVPAIASREDQFTAEEIAIGENIAEMIPDGATIQCGIGTVGEAVLSCLENHQELGYHSEMLTDSFLKLHKVGAITNEHKKLKQHETVCAFAVGSKELYDFVDDNPSVQFMETSFVNKPSNISQNPDVVAINSALEIDITGQVCADSVGPYIYSGVGGQTDFLRGACMSQDGKAIIALLSTCNGASRIVPFLKPGAGVVTTRAHVHYVVTEHGVADLFGKPIMERNFQMINIASPKHRDVMLKMMRDKFWMQPNLWFIPWMRHNKPDENCL